MSPHDLAKSLFLQALDVPASDRAAFLAAECGGDAALRSEVDGLLAFHEETLAGLIDLSVHETPPATIGGYRVLGELGRGGMGVVYRANREGGPEVALKVLKSGVVTPTMLARFRREARVLALLDHPGIARLIETGIETGPSGPRPWLAMQRIEGADLATWGRQEHGVAERLEMLARIADAVEHAHRHEIVHRDLKPENVLVRPDGLPVVLDFGVARLTDSDVRATTVMTTAGLIVGTIRYMSPEQAEARAEAIGPRSDVYSLGVIAYELLSGRLPYDVPEHSVHRALVAVMTAPPRAMDELPAPYRGRLERLLRAALAKDPADRVPGAGALAADLRRVAAGRPPLARPPRERGAIAAVPWRLVAALASGAALLGLVLSSWRTPPTPADWALGLLRPGAMFRRATTALDSATVRLHYTTRTLAREREALAWADRAGELVRTIGWRPYGARLERLALFRRGEAQYLIAERTNDAVRYEAAADLWYRSHEPRFPAARGPLPDTIGPSAGDLTLAGSPAGWLSASMALTDAARIARPLRLLGRAVELAREGEQALAQEALTAGALPAQARPRLADDSLSVAARLGTALVGHGYHGANERELRAGITQLSAAVRRVHPGRDAPTYASILHELGAGESRWAALTRDRAMADSARVHLERAWEVRSTLEGYTSRTLSRLELAQAHRLLARLDSTGDAPMRHLDEAGRLLALPGAETAQLPWIDARLYAIARSALDIDRCCLRRDSIGLLGVEARLLALERELDPRRTPMLVVESAAQRMRVPALLWMLTHDPREQRRAHQSIDLIRLGIGGDSSVRWATRLDDAASRLELSPRAPALDYPLAEPF